MGAMLGIVDGSDDGVFVGNLVGVFEGVDVGAVVVEVVVVVVVIVVVEVVEVEVVVVVLLVEVIVDMGSSAVAGGVVLAEEESVVRSAGVIVEKDKALTEDVDAKKVEVGSGLADVLDVKEDMVAGTVVLVAYSSPNEVRLASTDATSLGGTKCAFVA